jgi:hypothetical protein
MSVHEPNPKPMVRLSDAQIQQISTAATELPAAKSGVFAGRVVARLKLNSAGPTVSDDDVADAIRMALIGLRHRAQGEVG